MPTPSACSPCPSQQRRLKRPRVMSAHDLTACTARPPADGGQLARSKRSLPCCSTGATTTCTTRTTGSSSAPSRTCTSSSCTGATTTPGRATLAPPCTPGAWAGLCTPSSPWRPRAPAHSVVRCAQCHGCWAAPHGSGNTTRYSIAAPAEQPWLACRDASLPQELVPELKAKAESVGLKWEDFKVTDNSCQPHPPRRGLSRVRTPAAWTHLGRLVAQLRLLCLAPWGTWEACCCSCRAGPCTGRCRRSGVQACAPCMPQGGRAAADAVRACPPRRRRRQRTSCWWRRRRWWTTSRPSARASPSSSGCAQCVDGAARPQ